MVKERLAKLLEVKSIVTILMTVALVGLLVSGAEIQREVLMLFSTSYGAIITYFFTRKDNTAN